MGLARIANVLITGFLAGGAAALALKLGWDLTFHITIEADDPESIQVFWSTGRPFDEKRSRRVEIPATGRPEVSVTLPDDVRSVRVDPMSRPGAIRIRELRVSRLVNLFRWSATNGYPGWEPANQIRTFRRAKDHLLLESSGSDPNIVNEIFGAQIAGPLRTQHILVGAVVGLLAALLAGLLVARAPAKAPRPPAREEDRRERPAGPGPALGPRRAPKIALALGSFVIFAAAAWILLGHFFSGRRSGYHDPQGAYELSFLDDRGQRISGREGPLGLMLDPFTFYRHFPSQRGDRFSIDEHGFRGGIRDESLPRVFLLGSSAAFGHGLDSDDQTAAARLDRRLKSLTCVNAAVTGYLSGQELGLMIHYLDRWRPAFYIVIDGWNDFYEHQVSRRQLGVNTEYFHISKRLREYRLLQEGAPRTPWPFPAPPEAASAEEHLRDARAVYVSNLEKMNAWARGRGARFLVVFQPTVQCKRSPTKAEQRIGFEPGLASRYRSFIQEARSRCGKLGIEWLDLHDEAAFRDSPETLFLDPVHWTASGHEAVAAVIARWFRKNGG
jgi:lysophospholipase L1-like esterase